MRGNIFERRARQSSGLVLASRRAWCGKHAYNLASCLRLRADAACPNHAALEKEGLRGKKPEAIPGGWHLPSQGSKKVRDRVLALQDLT